MGEQSQLQYVTDLLLSCFRHLTLFGLSLVLIIAIVIRLLGNSHITLTHVSHLNYNQQTSEEESLPDSSS